MIFQNMLYFTLTHPLTREPFELEVWMQGRPQVFRGPRQKIIYGSLNYCIYIEKFEPQQLLKTKIFQSFRRRHDLHLLKIGPMNITQVHLIYKTKYSTSKIYTSINNKGSQPKYSNITFSFSSTNLISKLLSSTQLFHFVYFYILFSH